MKELRRTARIVVVDLLDVLRPPGFDIMVLLLASLGGILAVIQPLTRPYAMVFSVLEITIIATTIFLALRGAAGITSLIENGTIYVYLSYPLHRASVALALLVSRVVLPSLLLLSAPIVVSALMLWRQVLSYPIELVAMMSSYLVQAIFYGSVFAVFSLKAKSPGTSGVLSVAFYFAYNVLALILAQMGAAWGVDELTRMANSMILHIALYNIYSGAYNLSTWNIALVPTAAALASTAYIVYFARRFEP